ncbi:MAG: TIGR03960 family B12-binding radical SAM protein, partial [Lachnospiraceae bacterium]|nr:TIGR03960 family B12-binding radical SAM protein [Lachnospiraceae bacterium]
DFFDLFYIGEGETVYDELLDIYKDNKKQGGSRQDFLLRAAGVEGIYVPSLYSVSYNKDGTIKEMKPRFPNVPKQVRKQVQMDLTNTVYPLKPLVAFLRPTQDRVTLEIQRGCIRGCRFCQAGMIYRPLRERDVEELKRWAIEMLNATGHEEITLSSLSSSDYSALEELTYYLIDECKERYINISLPSLRIDAFSLDVMSRVQDVKKSSLTFAPEAGTQRMRDVINKGLTKETIINGAMEAFHGGWNKVKLYFMLGLPFETDEDVVGIPQLANDIAEAYYTIPKDARNGRVSINASASFFVPKPFTPFQWAPMNTEEEFLRKAYLANDQMHAMHNHRSLSFQYHDATTTILEGILARGDRRLCETLYHIYCKGAIFDAWTEWFQPELWNETFAEDGVDVAFYTTRERTLEEVFPWDFIDAGVTKEFLKKEYLRASQAVTTPNCRMQCQGCGAMTWKGGICIEGKNEVC